MKKTYISLLLFILVGFVFNRIALSWNDDTTHMQLSEFAADNSVLSKGKGDYLKNLGFVDGLTTNLKWGTEKTVKKWLAEGALLEDAGAYWQAGFNYARYNNHFHNPLQPWSSAGLTDGVPFTTKSAVLWAQAGGYQSAFPEGDQSWNTIRNLYLLALTSATDSERQATFAKTFKGLGHQLHLIEDMAQPDHVRNDSHIWDSLAGKNPVHGSFFFETWAKGKSALINTLAANPVFPTVPFNVSYDNFVPVTQLIDTKQYSQSKTPSVSLAQGLAEYTNANFFSDDTIFAAEKYSEGDKHYFPYPKKSSTNLQAYEDNSMLPKEIWAEDTVKDVAFYISKDKDGESIDYFVRSSYLTNHVKDENDKTLYYRTFYRDEVCHEDYAKKLIPRAVGYSAGLLNYFFRGKLDLVEDGTDYRIQNSSDEDIAGDISSFKLFYDDDNGNRNEIPLYFFDPSGNQYTDLHVTFTIPAHGISSFKVKFLAPSSEPQRSLLIFQGTLGNEKNAVAVGMKDIKSEPIEVKLYDQTGKLITRDVAFRLYGYNKSTGLLTNILCKYHYDKVKQSWLVSATDATFDSARGVFIEYADMAEMEGMFGNHYYISPNRTEHRVAVRLSADGATTMPGVKSIRGFGVKSEPIIEDAHSFIAPHDAGGGQALEYNSTSKSIRLAYRMGNSWYYGDWVYIGEGGRFILKGSSEVTYYIDGTRLNSLPVIIDVDASVLSILSIVAEYTLDPATAQRRGTVWTQYPGRTLRGEKFQEADSIALQGVISDVVPYISAAKTNITNGVSYKITSGIPYTLEYITNRLAVVWYSGTCDYQIIHSYDYSITTDVGEFYMDNKGYPFATHDFERNTSVQNHYAQTIPVGGPTYYNYRGPFPADGWYASIPSTAIGDNTFTGYLGCVYNIFAIESYPVAPAGLRLFLLNVDI